VNEDGLLKKIMWLNCTNIEMKSHEASHYLAVFFSFKETKPFGLCERMKSRPIFVE